MRGPLVLCALLATALVVPVAASTARGSPDVAVDGSLWFEVSYPNAGPFDWFLGRENCRLVQIADTGTAGTETYLWDWGDNSTESTNQSVARHRYQSGVYTVFVTTYSRTNATASYYLTVDAYGTGCSVRTFLKYAAFPLAMGSVGYTVGGLVLSRSKREERRRLGHRFLVVALLMLVGFVAATVFISGHIWPFS